MVQVALTFLNNWCMVECIKAQVSADLPCSKMRSTLYGTFYSTLLVITSCEFVAISNTHPGYTCHFYGAKEGKQYMSVIFQSSNTGALNVHAKAYKDGSKAEKGVTKDFFPNFCPLRDDGELKDDLQKVFSKTLPEYRTKRCRKILKASEQFKKHFDNLFHHSQLPDHNSLAVVHKEDCDGLLRSTDGTRISMHKDTYKMIEDYARVRNLSASDLIKQLYTKRPFSFKGELCMPRFKIEEGQKPSLITCPEGIQAWKSIGFSESYSNYDDILLASLLQVSSPVKFLSTCNFRSPAPSIATNNFIAEGYVSSVAGPRFQHLDLMDSIFMIKVANQSEKTLTPLQKILSDYYLKDLPSSGQKQLIRYTATDTTEERYFNQVIYRKRLRLSMIPFILDCEERLKGTEKKAILLVSGWGLFNWAVKELRVEMAEIFVDEFLQIIAHLTKRREISHISDVVFNYITMSAAQIQSNKAYARANFPDIKITVAKLEKVTEKFALETEIGPIGDEKVLFYAVASNGNAYPGNEYWMGRRDSAIDVAVAVCSTMASTQNPQINPDFTERYKIYE